MRVHLLIGQYKCDYPGQLAPNVFLAVDEFLMEENPAYWPKAVEEEKAKTGGEVDAWAEIVVEVETQAMLDALYPARKTLPAPVVSTHPEPHVGGWVKDTWDDADTDEVGYGYVDSIQDGGYGVIWNIGDTPKFVAADEVVYADPAEVPQSRTRV